MTRVADGVSQPHLSNSAMNTAIYKPELSPRGGNVDRKLTAANDAQYLMPPHLACLRTGAQKQGGAFDLKNDHLSHDGTQLTDAW